MPEIIVTNFLAQIAHPYSSPKCILALCFYLGINVHDSLSQQQFRCDLFYKVS